MLMNFSSILILFLSMLSMTLSLILYFNSTFISLEIPFMYLSSFNFPISIMLDWFSCLFMFTVLIISSMILKFSETYIPMKEHKKFSLMLMMFILSMMILITSDNIIFILLGWDGLGLSSYILVIYYQNSSASSSGSITILSNRIGDIMILMSIGTLMMLSNWNFNMNKEYQLISMAMLLIAALSKSAQFPFSAWLPAAMAAPTPISALVHSSTLVTAGVFLLIRIMNKIHPTSMIILMIISSMTTLYASMAANWEQDLKKIIALSTLSQIAMMMFAISLGSTSIAFFHLISHAFFKSTMFLCVGIMILNSSYQDMRHMGTSMENSPLTSTMLGTTSMALMGLPFMSGFFSKDNIIEMMIYSNLNSLLSLMMIFSIGLTTSYTLRSIKISMKMTLKSKPDINFSNSMNMNLPIIILSPLSILTGTWMLWMLTPEQLFMIPFHLKLSIMMIMILGFTTGMSLSFKSKKYLNMGEPSISLWFSHIISTMPMNTTNPIMNLSMKSDKLWQELYGPYQTFNQNMKLSKKTNKMSMMMFTIIMMTLTPIFILI